jgi:hypothetical protein
VIACTSPRTTEVLHQARDILRFANIVLVGRERSGLGCEARAPALALGGLRNRLACRLGATDAASTRDLLEGVDPLTAEPQRERMLSGGHDRAVAQIELHNRSVAPLDLRVAGLLPFGLMLDDLAEGILELCGHPLLEQCKQGLGGERSEGVDAVDQLLPPLVRLPDLVEGLP